MEVHAAGVGPGCRATIVLYFNQTTREVELLTSTSNHVGTTRPSTPLSVLTHIPLGHLVLFKISCSLPYLQVRKHEVFVYIVFNGRLLKACSGLPLSSEVKGLGLCVLFEYHQPISVAIALFSRGPRVFRYMAFTFVIGSTVC